MKSFLERRLLQATVALTSLIPILAGSSGVLTGFRLYETQSLGLDNHMRYLSGLLLGIGLYFLWSLPRIEGLTKPYRLLTGIIVIGGLARIAGLLQVDAPTVDVLAPLAVELIAVPLICWWQNSYARRAALSPL